MGIKGARDLMHLKSYAIDGRLLRPGSANWSPTGLKRQDNDVRYETTPEAVELFERKFAEMWNRAGNVESRGKDPPKQGSDAGSTASSLDPQPAKHDVSCVCGRLLSEAASSWPGDRRDE